MRARERMPGNVCLRRHRRAPQMVPGGGGDRGRVELNKNVVNGSGPGTTGYQPWATGVTDVAGTGNLSGHARTGLPQQ
jgi:hypothetical protein